MGILVDSSVWIDYFRDGTHSGRLDHFIDENIIVTNDLILTELIPFLKLKKQNEIISLLSKESVEKGALKKFQRETLNTVYYYFANELLDWHLSLIENIKTNFPDLSESEIEITSVRIINRLILLRFCESLGLEPVDQLKNILDKDFIYKSLLNIFEKANEKYNSGLFYFKKESSRNTDSLD